MKMQPRFKWGEEGVSIKLADLPYQASEEIASGFIVDSAPDNRVIGLEILWPEAERAGCASEPVLAFGLFCAALAGVSWQYNDHLRGTRPNPVAGIHSRLAWMINAAGVKLNVQPGLPDSHYAGTNGSNLVILDVADNPLIVAVIKRGQYDRNAVRGYTDLLQKTIALTYPYAIGIGVFIDETGHGYRNEPVEPGVWTDWHTTAVLNGQVWVHNTIIPPSGCDYPWLPKQLRDPMFKANI